MKILLRKDINIVLVQYVFDVQMYFKVPRQQDESWHELTIFHDTDFNTNSIHDLILFKLIENLIIWAFEAINEYIKCDIQDLCLVIKKVESSITSLPNFLMQ